MNEIFSEEIIKNVYFGLKDRKLLFKNKALPIGIDGVSSTVFEKKLDQSIREIQRKLLPRDGRICYTFAPLLRIYKNKSGGGTRQLHIPRLRDQVVMRLVHDELKSHLLSKSISIKTSSPFRYVSEFDDHIRRSGNEVIIKSDIVRFYDSIPRDRVIELCRKTGVRYEVMQLLETWSRTLRIRSEFSDRGSEIADFTGLPQGISLSSLLAELYATQIDEEFYNDDGYFRYVDDIAICCKSFEDAKHKLDRLERVVTGLGLNLSQIKTRIVLLSEGLDWLGLTHFPNKKWIDSEKIVQSVRPIRSFQKSCIEKLAYCETHEKRIQLVSRLMKEVGRYISGRHNTRLRWYSLCEDTGQWRKMDRSIHQLLRSCIRKARLLESDLPLLPSVHAKVLSYKKIRGVTKNADQG